MMEDMFSLKYGATDINVFAMNNVFSLNIAHEMTRANTSEKHDKISGLE